MSERERFITYVTRVYGRNGVWVLKRDGKHLTKAVVRQKVRASFPRPEWCGGDSIDREAFRFDVLQPAGWLED